MKKLLLAGLILCLGASLAQAQVSYFKVQIENIGQAYNYTASGFFNTPVDANSPAPIGPGQKYAFSFDAAPGARLSFVSMFVPSNDLFFAPDEQGIALWDDNGNPIDGDVTDQIALWDAGTEVNQEPGVGPDQVQRQADANTGDSDANATLRMVDDGFTYPAVADVVRVTISSEGGTRFKAEIENVSANNTLAPSDGSMQAVPLSPGVWVVHSNDAPIFADGEDDRGEGLEDIAEDGNPARLAELLGEQSGVTTVFSPGVWATHVDSAPLFEQDAADRGDGLEAIAEDGMPGMLADSLALELTTTGGAFAIPKGGTGPAPLPPGQQYEFTIAAKPGSYLSFATMYVQSNDLFIAPGASGIALWDNTGTPLDGDVTDQIALWDAGTEVNERPGVGMNQAPRQAGANTGDDENGVVHLVNDGFSYPDLQNIVRITVTPLQTIPFTIRIENVSSSTTLAPSDGSMQAVPLSPGVWAVHSSEAPLFSAGKPDRSWGLEAIAEDGSPGTLNAALGGKVGYDSGIFNTPEGGASPAPIGPGGSYAFTVEAAPGAALSFMSMFVPSNDLFYGPEERGIALWDGAGNPISGDVTDQIQLWDAGTEINQEPGVGPDQVQRQAGPNTGAADPNSLVRLVDDAFSYPAVSEVIRVTVEATTTNIQEASAVPSSFTLHQNYPNPFNPQTTIGLELRDSGTVRLSVYNMLGQKVADLLDGFQSAGTYQVQWDGRDAFGSEVATGVYLYRVDIGGASAVRKMILLR